MDQITIHCACGRKMGPDALAGRGAYRCGCGARVRLELHQAPDAACVAREKGIRCRLLPVTEEPVPLCGAHARALKRQMLAFGHPNPLQAEEDCVVYYVQFGDRIKIGMTGNLARRIANLPHDRLLAVEGGGVRMERHRHQQFAEFRITGEWFRAAPELLRHIDELANRVVTGTTF